MKMPYSDELGVSPAAGCRGGQSDRPGNFIKAVLGFDILRSFEVIGWAIKYHRPHSMKFHTSVNAENLSSLTAS
jgi:hypothetical protein